MKIGAGGWVLRGMLGLGLLGLDACAMVGVSHVNTHDYVSQRRPDVIVTGRPSDRTGQSLNVVALTPDSCQREFAACTDTVARSAGLTDEQRLSALAELWLGRIRRLQLAALQKAD